MTKDGLSLQPFGRVHVAVREAAHQTDPFELGRARLIDDLEMGRTSVYRPRTSEPDEAVLTTALIEVVREAPYLKVLVSTLTAVYHRYGSKRTVHWEPVFRMKCLVSNPCIGRLKCCCFRAMAPKPQACAYVSRTIPARDPNRMSWPRTSVRRACSSYATLQSVHRSLRSSDGPLQQRISNFRSLRWQFGTSLSLGCNGTQLWD